MVVAPSLPSTSDAVAASVACARALGLPSDDPRVVADGYSVRVRLHPAPVLTRVVTVGRVLRGDPLPWMRRELAVAGFLAGVGARAVRPWAEPGPHLHHGLEVTLWQAEEVLPGVVADDALGPLLHEVHEALTGYPGELPVLVGPLTDVESARRRSDDPVLHAAADALVPLALSWPRRPLHGDAHTGNVLLTADGPVWADWEDVCVGPAEWDLASTTVSDAAVASYPGELDHDLLEDCRDLRRLQVLAAVLTDDVQDPALYDGLVERLARRC